MPINKETKSKRVKEKQCYISKMRGKKKNKNKKEKKLKGKSRGWGTNTFEIFNSYLCGVSQHGQVTMVAQSYNFILFIIFLIWLVKIMAWIGHVVKNWLKIRWVMSSGISATFWRTVSFTFSRQISFNQ